MNWTTRARTRFADKWQIGTPKTPETPLSGVLGVPTQRLFRKQHSALGVSEAGRPRRDDSSLLRRLLGASRRACDFHHDSDSARQLMRADILNTPAHLYEDLLGHFNRSYPEQDAEAHAAPNP